MSKPAAIRYLRSAGGVIFRITKTGPEVALILTKNRLVWTLPKGIIDKDESPEQAAAREILEETGLLGKIIDSLGEKSYWFFLKEENTKCKKTVTYFLLEHVSGEICGSNPEVEEARWFSIDEAISMLTFASDREILSTAKEKIDYHVKNNLS